jgi:hypothetical protein
VPAVSLVWLLASACGREEMPPPSSAAELDSAQATTVIGPASPGILVDTCAPCFVRVGRDVSDFTVTFAEVALPDGRRGIAELRLLRRDRPAWSQSFPVRDSAAILQAEQFFLGATDINFDGYGDLFVATSRGVANAYADYWLFTPPEQQFVYLGNYPVFTVDSAQTRLKTHERGGAGGLIYEARQYQFVDGVLTVVESETQEATDQPGVYRREVRRLTNGELRAVSSEIVRPPAP